MEDAIRHAGGMGRFQWLLTLMYQLIFSCGSFSLYPMMYYELQPIYRCRENESQDWFECKQEDFCETDLTYEINYHNPLSLHNWVELYGMQCSPKAA